MTAGQWTALGILAPLVGAVLVFVLGRAREVARRLVVAVSAVAGGAPLVVLGQGGEHALGGWGAPLGVVLRVDGLSALLLATTAAIMAPATWYGRSWLSAHPRVEARSFWGLWFLLWSGLAALFASGDLFNLYVSLEVVGLSAVALVSATRTSAALAGALRYLMVSLGGSLSFLLGVALLYGQTGVLDLELLAARVAPSPVTWLAFGLMGVGLLLKTALFPLHFWLPPAHGAAPPQVSAVLSGLVVEGGFYILLRLGLQVFPEALAPAAPVLGTLGGLAVLWGGVQALRQPRLKGVVAWSTVAQLGYLFLAFPLAARGGVDLALAGAGWFVASHGLAKAALFLAAGVLHAANGHDRIGEMTATGPAVRAAWAAFAIAGVSIAGLPPTGGFVAKWLLLEGAFATGAWPLVGVLVGGGLLAAAYLVRVLSPVLASRPQGRPGAVSPWTAAPALSLSLGAVGLGFAAHWGLGVVTGSPTAALDVASGQAGLLLAILLSSLVPAAIIFVLPEAAHRTRTTLNLLGAAAKVGLVLWLGWAVAQDASPILRVPFLPHLPLVLHADALSILFAILSAGLWFVTTVYAVGYLEGGPRQSRFFGFFSLCVSATVGIALAGDLFTFLVFYELLTLATWPLVVHRGTPAALAGGRKYLAYTLVGGAALLMGTAWLTALVGPVPFRVGGILAPLADQARPTLLIIFALLLAGLGVKAALFPLHGWLPSAMVAPAPVSALLHAVAVVKAGAFGIVRVVYDVFGVSLAAALGVTTPVAALAAFTIVYGSWRALSEDDLKRRLAWSTVSQVSYIALGATVVGPLATIGGVVHLVHQGLMKITLFFAAGALAESLGVHRVSELNGVGRRMPVTMAAFTLAAFGMIGVPPVAGFISKWFLGVGAVTAGQFWVLPVLVTSTLLNAAYFLPIVHRAWFEAPATVWPPRRGGGEAGWMLVGPTLTTAAAALAMGIFANAPFSALAWVRALTALEYGP